jgi:predicted RNA-binding Zn-ribbon protein involved in translation (DUF1610 family)
MARHEVKRAPFDCPNCGAEVPGDAHVCPECGSDEETGWSEETMYDGVDFPDPYGDEEPQESSGRLWIIITGAIVILLVLLFAFAR